MDPSKSSMLENLQQQWSSCQRCTALLGSRLRVVFGRGSAEAVAFLLGEAPGASEAALGEPFVGPAGGELSRAARGTLEFCYITNIICCRPPNNRSPLPDEEYSCRQRLLGQLRIINPRLLVTLGRCSLDAMAVIPALGLGQHLDLALLDEAVKQAAPALTGWYAAYHPAYVLHSPFGRKAVDKDWDILRPVIEQLVRDARSS